MNIQQYKTFKFNALRQSYQYLQKSTLQDKITYILSFLEDYYGYIGRPERFLAGMQAANGEWGIDINELDINFDIEKSLVYIGKIFDSEDLNMTEQEFNIKYNNPTSVQICKQGFVPCNVITKDNFIYLFTKWGNYLKNKSPFVLLYIDDNN